MGKNKKTVLKSFDYLHCDDFAAYLEEMAGKGWHFKEWGAGLVFEMGVPEKACYAVEVFMDGTEYDTRPEVHTQEFAEYCEAAGWVLVDAKRKFCIFKKVREDAVEILTDEERLSNIAKEEQRGILRELGTAMMWCILQTLQFSGSGFVNRIFSNPMLLIMLLWYAMAFAAVGRGLHFLVWKRNAAKYIADGKRIWFGKKEKQFSFLSGWYTRASTAMLVLYIIGLVLLGDFHTLFMIVIIMIPILLMCYLIAKFRPDALTNQIVQTIIPCIVLILVLVVSLGIMFSDDGETADVADVPLLYEEIGEQAGELEEITLDGSTSIFGSGLRCWLYYEEEHVYYQVYKSDYPWVLDTIWNREMERKYNQLGTDVNALWNAKSAIRNVPGSYLVRYNDTILILNFAEDTILSREQAEIIRKALVESR